MKTIVLSLLVIKPTCSIMSQFHKLEAVQDTAYHGFHDALQPHIGITDLRDVIAGYIGCKFKHAKTYQLESWFFKWSISPDGKYLARDNHAANCIINLHDLQCNRVQKLSGHANFIHNLEFFNSKYLISCDVNDLKIWLFPSGACIHTKRLHVPLQSMSMLPTDSKICLLFYDGQINIFDIKNNTSTVLIKSDAASGDRLSDAQFSSDGKSLFLLRNGTSENEKSVILYDMCQKTKLTEYKTENGIFSMCPNPKYMSVLMSGSSKGWQNLLTIWDSTSNKTLDRFYISNLMNGSISVKFTPDGNYIAVLHSGDVKNLRIHSATNFAEYSALLDVDFRTFKFLKNSSLVADIRASTGDAVQIWNPSLDIEEAALPIAVSKLQEPRSYAKYYACIIAAMAIAVYYVYDYFKYVPAHNRGQNL